MLSFMLGAGAGVILKILVPMPFLDQPVKNAWAKILGLTKTTSTGAAQSSGGMTNPENKSNAPPPAP